MKAGRCRHCKKWVVWGEQACNWMDLDAVSWRICPQATGNNGGHEPFAELQIKAAFNTTRSNGPDPQVYAGDRVVVRATVLDEKPAPSPEHVLVDFDGETEYGVRRVPRAAVELIGPVEDRRTASGYTVKATRSAIGRLKARIMDDEHDLVHAPESDAVAFRLGIASMKGVVADLEQQLRDIGAKP
jgi:hypothetical protein